MQLRNMLSEEKIILNVLLHKPKLIHDFNINYFYTDIAKSLFKTIQKEVKERNIESSLSDLTVLLWFDKELQLQQAIRNVVSTDLDLFSFNANTINDLIFNLEKAIRKAKTQEALQKALQFVQEDNMQEADQIVASLHIQPVEALKDTYSLIAQSLNESAVFKSGLQLDKYTGLLSRKSLMSIAGEPGTMKTYFSMWYIINILRTNPTFTALYFEKEMPASDIALRIASYIIGQDMQTLKSMMFDKQGDSILENVNKLIANNPEYKSIFERFHIVDDYRFNSVADVEKYIKRYKADVYCIDYIQQMVNDSDINGGITQVTTELKQMTNNNNCFGIILSQVNDKDIARRVDRIPKDTDMQYGTRIKQNVAYSISLFYPHKAFGGKIPIGKCLSSYYYTIIGKTRDSVNEKDVCPFIIDMKNGFFQDLTNVEDYNLTYNWFSSYREYVKNEESKYKRS